MTPTRRGPRTHTGARDSAQPPTNPGADASGGDSSGRGAALLPRRGRRCASAGCLNDARQGSCWCRSCGGRWQRIEISDWPLPAPTTPDGGAP